MTLRVKSLAIDIYRIDPPKCELINSHPFAFSIFDELIIIGLPIEMTRKSLNLMTIICVYKSVNLYR